MAIKYTVILSIVLLTGCGTAGGVVTSDAVPSSSGTINLADADAAPAPSSSGGSCGCTTGATGAAGAQGPAGPAGAQGPQGAAGPAGVGSAGPQGETGPQGPAGATGAAGQPGGQGPAGATGPAGPTGAAGSGISKANIYTATGLVHVGGGVYPTAGVAVAACTSGSDVLLTGGCQATMGFSITGFGPVNADADAGIPSYDCAVEESSTASGIGTGTATVVCLKMP